MSSSLSVQCMLWFGPEQKRDQVWLVVGAALGTAVRLPSSGCPTYRTSSPSSLASLPPAHPHHCARPTATPALCTAAHHQQRMLSIRHPDRAWW